MLNQPQLIWKDVDKVRQYIHHAWPILTRDHTNYVDAARDPKCPDMEAPYPVYLPPEEDYQTVVERLRSAMPSEDFKKITIKMLPHHSILPREPGLLYLPHPYVVPGGRFNELYSWDSFFIILGLLVEGEYQLAKHIVDNLAYQIQHYGKILNANRSYYLDRSNPPLFSQMVTAVYKQIQDKRWLASVLPQIETYYFLWAQTPRLIPSLDLARYYVSAEGPAPEVLFSEDSNERRYYQQAIEYFDEHVLEQPHFRRFYNPHTHRLTPAFYKSDRSVRESGFDLSGKYGPFGVEIIDHAPIGLNTLVYQMEKDIAYFKWILGDEKGCKNWNKRAQLRSQRISRYCWDPELGFFADYNYRQQRRRPYLYGTTFLPLWAGIATEEQVERVKNNLSGLEAAGGVKTSAYVTGSQWDAPFGWAPLHYFAVHGLLRYGYRQEAERIACKFVAMLNDDFKFYGVLLEKYNVITRQSHVTHEIRRGYQSNEIGFGWTNGVYLDFVYNVLGDMA